MILESSYAPTGERLFLTVPPIEPESEDLPMNDRDRDREDNPHDAVLALYITREELTEFRRAVIQFGSFMQQQAELNKFMLNKLETLGGELRQGEDTKKNLQIDDLRRQLKERDDREAAAKKDRDDQERSAKWATYGIVAAIAVGLLGGGCSIASAWMTYTQPRMTITNGGGGK